jgi:hypothetical protein
MADLTDSELDSQLAKLLLAKKERDDAKQRAEQFEAKNQGKPAELLYWQAESYETLAELHKKYSLAHYDFCIILHKAIKERDSTFAVKLILSELITPVIAFNCNCHYQQVDQLMAAYFVKTVELCMANGDFARIRALEMFHSITLLHKHSIHSPFIKDYEPIQGITEFENCKIYNLAQQNRSIANTHSNFYNADSPKHMFLDDLTKSLHLTTCDAIVKYVIFEVKRASPATHDFKFLDSQIHRWICDENMNMLEFAVANTFITNQPNYACSAIYEHMRQKLNEIINGKFNFTWFKALVNLIKKEKNYGCPVNIGNINENNIPDADFDVFVYVMNIQLTQGNPDYKTQNMAQSKQYIRELLYLSSKHGRTDIFDYLITLRV